MPSLSKTALFGASTLISVCLFVTTSFAQFQNPLAAAKDAYKKARQQQQQQQQQQKPASQPQAGATPGATPKPAATADAPWTPPADSGPAPVALDPAKMPDVIGVRLGMTPQAALQALHKQYPVDRYTEMQVNWWPEAKKPDYGYNVTGTDPLATPDAYLSFTAPPNPQVVWKIARFTYHMHINHATLLTALREKYGKESIAFTDGGERLAEDRGIANLYWLFDEGGNRVPMPPAGAFPGYGNLQDCASSTFFGTPQPVMPVEMSQIDNNPALPCGSFVWLHIHVSPAEIVENSFTEMVDVPLGKRTALASMQWKHDRDEKARKEDIERSKSAKPVF